MAAKEAPEGGPAEEEVIRPELATTKINTELPNCRLKGAKRNLVDTFSTVGTPGMPRSTAPH